MPIPTTEPPVKRYVLRQVAVGRMEDWIAKMLPADDVQLLRDDETYWVKWSEAEALLLQRAQEIEQVQAALRKANEENQILSEVPQAARRDVSDELPLRDALAADAALVSRALENGDLRSLVARADDVSREMERYAAGVDQWEPPRPVVESWSRVFRDMRSACEAWKAVADRFRAENGQLRAAADAALVSRAPQQEHEEIHRDCHDLVCNGSRNHPRGAKGVSCSCRYRDASAAAPLPASAALQDLIVKWNKKADELPEMAIGLSYSHALRLALRACAVDLAAALSRADQP